MPIVGEDQDGHTIDVPVGQTIEISLPENATTGFRWDITSNGEPTLRLLHDDRQAPARAQPGAGGMHRWQWQAQQAGAGDVALAYRRHWEAKAAPARVFKIHVRAK
jgi:inhibitor of cysteine peptidase